MDDVQSHAVRRFLLACLLLAVCAGCGSQPQQGADSSVPVAPTTTAPAPSTTVTTAPPAPTTTVYAPDTVEGQIEAAYLRSWEVFGEAITQADPTMLRESYAGEALHVLEEQVQELIDDGQSVRIEVRHDLNVQVISENVAALTNVLENHSVTVDRASGEPSEPDPNSRTPFTYTLERGPEGWQITEIIESTSP